MRRTVMPRRRRQRWPLVRVFALRSAVAFVLVGVVLHFLVERLVEEQFHSHAEFHATFVTEAVLQPKLLSADIVDDATAPERAQMAEDLRRYIIDLDDAVYSIVIWDLAGSVLAASDVDHLEVDIGDDQRILLEASRGEPVSVDGPAPYLAGEPPVPSTLRTFVPVDVGQPLVVEVHQDWSPTLAASRTFSRTLDAGLIGGIALLWALSLPIARRAGRRLHERSRTDELTGLPNRTALEEQLDRTLDRVDRSRREVVLLFVDLDGFKTINDTLGHAAGDDVLRQIAARLRACTRTIDVVSRFAGDEFVVILEHAGDEVAGEVARRILEEVREPLEGVGDLGLTASIGMAVDNGRSLGPDALLRHADAAMYHVKSGGGDGFRVFDARLRDQVARRNQITSQLRGAIARGELSLHFQPFVALGSPDPRPVAVEALLRWTHPELGVVSPGEFVPLAERDGAIEPIGDWVIRTACEQVAAWQRRVDPGQPFTVYVNLSAIQLTKRLSTVVDDCLRDTGADPARLGFEITETAVLAGDDDAVIELLARLRDRGCHVALDDFGTGYSSLSRLRETPLDLLKLDGSFVHRRSDDGRERAILTAVSRLAREMGIQVLAEGIETSEQLDAVTGLGFDLAQGYHLARPARATDVVGWLDDGLPSCAQTHAPAELAAERS